MDKNSIKIKLKEAITKYVVLVEAKRNKLKISESGENSNEKDNQQNAGKKPQQQQHKTGKKDYADVQRAFQRLGGPSMVDIMVMVGTPDDEVGTNRSLFRKKVLQKRNKDTGSYYQFDDEELDRVRAAIDSQKG